MLGAAGAAGRAGLRKVREGAALGEGVSGGEEAQP